ncbi:Chemotaxis signal transduction protein [Candidatus Terasakiella magnetica]|nr:Chemotaxis signal transduction protein [Candidatus Terasakiella magnetica]
MAGKVEGPTEKGTVLARLHARLAEDNTDRSAEFAEALLRVRARRLAQPRHTGDERVKGIDILCFTLGAERYAVALADLSEVMPLDKWVPVPGQPASLLGVTNLRGEIRPVLDLHTVMGLALPAEDARSWVVFMDNDGAGAEIGLRVDRLESIIELDTTTLTRPLETGNGLPQHYVAGITPDALVLLDTRQILALDVLNDSRRAS